MNAPSSYQFLKKGNRQAWFILLVLALNPYVSECQHEMDNWFFGHRAGLDFSTGEPIVINGSNKSTIEACATISDSNGNLLFYITDKRISNKNHNTMPNGTLTYGDNNATQGFGIVKMPKSEHKYYVFALSFAGSNGDYHCDLYYSVVDMSLDNQKGDVVEKDILLDVELSEKLTFIRKPNSSTIWLVSHKHNSKEYVVIPITAEGFGDTKTYATNIMHDSRYGYLQPSPNGATLAAAVKYSTPPFVEIACFDPDSGIVNGSFKLEMPSATYGVCFSPDNSRLYVTAGTPNHLYQFDMTLGSQDSIENSRIQISTTPLYDDPGISGALQLAPNGRIYVARYEHRYIGAVNQPNALGLDCDFIMDGADLGEIGRSEHGLPNTGNLYQNNSSVNVIDCYDVLTTRYTNSCDGILVYPNPSFGNITIKSMAGELNYIGVSDITGRELYSEYRYDQKSRRADISLDFDVGTYILQVSYRGPDCFETEKLVVVR